MTNTGFKQATVVYKVRAYDSTPLDINGVPIAESGRLQAIALLTGVPNPNAALYEVELIYAPEAIVYGTPTVIYDNINCIIGYLTATPAAISLTPVNTSAVIVINSSDPWTLASYPTGIFTVDITSGAAGTTNVTITRTGTLGQGAFIFQNVAQVAQVYAYNADNAVWVLATGFWNDNGVWIDTSIWNS